jgi:molybdate transport system ATP-binding protein
MIEIAVRHRFGAFALDAAFATDGRLIALFGRSGTGKTSLVNVVAGLVRPTQGRIIVDGHVLLDTARGIAVPTHRRRIGYVFQESRLFPHLTVRQNLLYGRWFAPRTEHRDRFAEIVDLLGIGALLERRPAHLSGGEAQRVAIGRALLASPRLLLMDEPLAALDAERKAEILPYVERLRDEAGVPIIYVSHAVAEVARLATTIVVLAGGKIAACGPAAEVMARPDLMPVIGRLEAGALIAARVAGHDAAHRLTRLICRGGEILVPLVDRPVGAAMRLRVRARDVMLATERPHGISALNILEGSIAEVAADARGPGVNVRLDLAPTAGDPGPPQSLLARVTTRSAEELGLAPGRPVFAILKTVAIDRGSFGAGIGLGDLDEADGI